MSVLVLKDGCFRAIDLIAGWIFSITAVKRGMVMYSGFMVLLGLCLVGIFLFYLNREHGPGSED